MGFMEMFRGKKEDVNKDKEVGVIDNVKID